MVFVSSRHGKQNQIGPAGKRRLWELLRKEHDLLSWKNMYKFSFMGYNVSTVYYLWNRII